MRPTVDHVKMTEAMGQLTSLLMRLGVDRPEGHAREFIRDMVDAGWRHTRPRVDPVPPDGPPADPAVVEEAARAARAAIPGGGS